MITVTVDPPADAGDDNSTTVCDGTVVDLSGLVSVGGGSFADDDGTGALTVASFDTAGLSPGSYNFTYTVASGNTCPADTALITVTVDPLPNLTVSNVYFCENEAPQGYSLATYASSIDAETTVHIFSGEDLLNIIIDYLNGGEEPAQLVALANYGDVPTENVTTYFAASMNNVSGCYSIGSFKVTVHAVPDANITPVDPICSTDAPIQLIGSPDGGTWSGIGVDENGMFDPSIAGEGDVDITYEVENSNGCIDSDIITITVESCGGYCTYTQGFYGNVGGMNCSPEGGEGGVAELQNAYEMMLSVLPNPGDEYVFGNMGTGNWFKLTHEDITSNNIFNMLPGGGTPSALTGSGTYNDQGTWGTVPLVSGGKKSGGIKNSLMAQTMTLYFNLGIDSGLGDWELLSEFHTSASIECGSDEGVAMTETYNISLDVIDYLNNNNGGATVSTLLDLANDVLGGVVVDIAPGAVSSAADAINNGFDECRILREYADSDGDGYNTQTDCNDDNASINPGMDETPYNGIDDDCNPDTLDDDLDGDGYNMQTDCDDTNAAINPDSDEVCGNGVDENCNGMDDDICPVIVDSISLTQVAEFTAYPVPFDEEVSVKYNYNFDTTVRVDVFDTKGALIRTMLNDRYIRGTEGVTHIDLSNTANQMLYVRLTTNKGTLTKGINSSSPRRRAGY